MARKKKATDQAPSKQQAQAEGPGKPPQTPGQRAWEWVKSLAIALAVWFVLQAMLIKAFRIPSGSMEETILIGDWLFVNRAVYGAEIPFVGIRLPAISEPVHDDIVVFDSPIEPGLDVVKRLIGEPGDTLEMRSDSLFRNGTHLREPYAHSDFPGNDMPTQDRRASRRWQVEHFAGPVPSDYLPGLRTWGPIVVPEGHLFVMGDNRDDSLDSRYWGFLPRENVKGRTMFVYYSYDPSSWRPLPFMTAIRWDRLFRNPG